MPKVRKRRNSSDSHTELTVCSKKAKSKLKDNLEENEDAVLSMDDEVADKTVSPQPLVVKNEDASTSKTSFYKPPTFEELQNLKEAEMLFQSNLLKLQITELLAEVRPKKKPSLDTFLHTMRSVLLSIKSTESMNLHDALTHLPRHVKYPLKLDYSSAVKGNFHFTPPQSVKVIGSYLLQSLTKPELNVDVAVEIPRECLQAKDHLNYRYFHKRALYLCHIAAALKKKEKLLKNVKFSYMNSDPLLPIIILNPILNDRVSTYTVKLHPCMPEGMFKITKLGPDRNNVRDTSAGEDQENPATPHYNNALLQNMNGYQRHLHDIFNASQDCTAFADAVMLFKVWLRQREFYNGYGCFNGFLISMLLAYLLHHRKLHKLMTSYQILRITLEHIASHDWTIQGISLATHNTVPLEKFHAAYEVVFVDSTGYYNLCGNMSSPTYHRVQHEAIMALKLLEKESTESFEDLFMTKMPFIESFDAVCHICPLGILTESIQEDDGQAAQHAVLKRLYTVLSKGLNNRVTNLSIKLQHNNEWLVSKAPPDSNNDPVTLGMLLTDKAFAELELGPPADSPEASAFRSFWGDVSELRRFQDGSINEAVVWESSCDAEGRRIVEKIILHLCNRHFRINRSHVTFTTSHFDQVISLPHYMNADNGNPRMCSTGEEMSHRVLQIFEDLNKQLRNLSQLPLAVTSVVGTSPVFRHTEVFPPVPWTGRFRSHLASTSFSEDDSIQSQCLYPNPDHATPPYVHALNVVCQLESSGKWPDEAEAIQQIKTAFYIKMSELLSRDRSLVLSPTFSHLDILKDGFVFRIKIIHPWEIALRKAAVKKEGESKQVVLEMERDLIILPILSSSLLGVHQEYPAFSVGARLCKRWLCCQLLSNHISEEAVELIVSDLFQSCGPYSPPSSPSAVLLRFLHKLSQFDWNNIIDIAKRLLPLEEETHSRLGVLFPAPPTVVQDRIKLLSDKAYELLSSQLDQPDQSDIDFKQIFRPPLQDYNVLIYLNKKHIAQAHYALDITTDIAIDTATKGKKLTKLPVVDFDPVKIFVKELERTFSDFALFFHDAYGGNYIAVVWKPNLFLPHSLKISQVKCRVPTGKRSQKVTIDVDSILQDFQIMGNSLVKSIEVISDSQ